MLEYIILAMVVLVACITFFLIAMLHDYIVKIGSMLNSILYSQNNAARSIQRVEDQVNQLKKDNTMLRIFIFIAFALSMTAVSLDDAAARGRTGSHRSGGYNSHGKGSHYYGGH